MSLVDVKVTSAPSAEPLELAEAKVYLNLPSAFTDHDDLIEQLIAGSRQFVEQYTGRALITQTRQAYFNEITDKVWLPYVPIQSVTTVEQVLNDEDTTLTVDSDYWVQGVQDSYLLFSSSNIDATRRNFKGFAGYELKVTYVCGYGDASDIPPLLLQAVYEILKESYENRCLCIPDCALNKMNMFTEVVL